MKIVRRSLAALLVGACLLTFGGTGHAAQRSRQARQPGPAFLAETFRALRGGLAQIGLGDTTGGVMAIEWLGSGFLVDAKCTLATAKQILDAADRERLVVRFSSADASGGPLTFSARVLYVDPDGSLAFLRFGGGMPGSRVCGSGRMDVLPLARQFSTNFTGEPVFIGGFPVLAGERPPEAPIVRRAVVSSADLRWDAQPMLLLDLAGGSGLTGGPVVLERTGEVVGVLHGPAATDRAYRYGMEWAAPITREDHRQALESSRGGR